MFGEPITTSFAGSPQRVSEVSASMAIVTADEIRQIEIVKGPNSALFGFNAVGGVINIVTFNPLYDDVSTGSVTGGTQNLVRGSRGRRLQVWPRGGIAHLARRRTDRRFLNAPKSD